jgi:hypothetical protein
LFHEPRGDGPAGNDDVPFVDANVDGPFPYVELITNGIASVRSRSSMTGGPEDGLLLCLRDSRSRNSDGGAWGSFPFQLDPIEDLDDRFMTSVGRVPVCGSNSRDVIARGGLGAGPRFGGGADEP